MPGQTVNQESPVEGGKRDLIMAAALSLLLDRGFGAMRMQDVADAAGVAAGTLYLHFKSKEDLANQLYRHWCERFTEEVLAAIPERSPFRLRFGALVAAMLDFARRHPRELAYIDVRNHIGYLDEGSQASPDRFDDFVLTLIREGQEQALLKAGKPEAILSLLLGALIGVVGAARTGTFELDAVTLDLCDRTAWDLVRA